MPVVTADEARGHREGRHRLRLSLWLGVTRRSGDGYKVDHANPDHRALVCSMKSPVRCQHYDPGRHLGGRMPNSGITPYSFLWMDLRAEPLVVTMPKIEMGRYYSAQLIDLQTFNFAYLGTRAFGNDGGDFLIAGPGWKGEQPTGIKAVIHCETEIAYVLFRHSTL